MSHSASSGPTPESGERPPRARRWPLLAVLALCAAPVIAAWVAYFVWPPQERMNYGELIPVTPLRNDELRLASGEPFRFSALRGKWVMLMVGPSACDSACQLRLVYLRQVRLSLGKNQERVERVWILTDAAAPDPAMLREHPGLVVLRASGGRFVQQFPVHNGIDDHIYVVDPLGNLMLRFPADPDPSRMRRDLSRLLQVSRIG